MMRVAGFALLGFLSGAIIGLSSAFLFVMLWYDVLGIGTHGADGLSGFATLIAAAAVLTPLGGVAGAIWMGSSARAAPPGPPSCAWVVALILAPLLLLACIVLATAI
jgi:hypothetical protein